MKKKIRIYKHPYAFDLNVSFGTLEEMLNNAYHITSWGGKQVEIGGNFNRRIDQQCGIRAAFIAIGVQLTTTPCEETKWIDMPKEELQAKGIRIFHWGGTYCFDSCFDEELKKGLYPVSADWDGRTYIVRGNYDTNHKWVERYELTETFVY